MTGWASGFGPASAEASSYQYPSIVLRILLLREVDDSQRAEATALRVLALYGLG